MIKSETENFKNNSLSDATNVLLAKVKELLNITKERLKKTPQHPLHIELKEELFDLQTDMELNGTDNNRKYLK